MSQMMCACWIGRFGGFWKKLVPRNLGVIPTEGIGALGYKGTFGSLPGQRVSPQLPEVLKGIGVREPVNSRVVQNRGTPPGHKIFELSVFSQLWPRRVSPWENHSRAL